MRAHLRYKPALAALLLALPGAAMAVKAPGGAELPDGATQTSDHRYKLTKNWEEALRYFKTIYPPAKYPRKKIVEQPGVKAIHLANPEAKPGTWEGLNIYEVQGNEGSEVRVFVLMTPGEVPKKKPHGKHEK